MRADAQKKIQFRKPLLLGAAALLLLCWVAAKRVRFLAQGSTNAHEQVGLIPVAGLLAAAKALSQVGVPVGAKRAAVPADNPLSEAEIDDVVAFLASLTSSQYKERGIQESERQRAPSRTDRPPREGPRLWAEAGAAQAVAQSYGFASRDKFEVAFPVAQIKKDVCQTRTRRSSPEHPRVLARV